MAAGIVLAFAITLTVIFFTVQFALQRILNDNLDDSLGDAAGLMQAELTLAGSLDNPRLDATVQRYAGTLEAREPFITVIWDPNGDARWITEGVQAGSLALTEEERARVLTGDVIYETMDLANEKEYRARQPLRPA